jgi:hypothetical protein
MEAHIAMINFVDSLEIGSKSKHNRLFRGVNDEFTPLFLPFTPHPSLE